MSTPSSVIYDAANNVIGSSDLVNAVHQAGYGTSPQVYTSNGAGVKPTFQAAGVGTGGLVWLASSTASASATIDFANNLSATYDNYLVTIEDCLPATNDVGFFVQVGTGGGPTYQATLYVSQGMTSAGSTLAAVAGGTVSVQLVVNASSRRMANTASRAGQFDIMVYGANTATDKTITSISNHWVATTLVTGNSLCSGRWQSATVITSLRFLMSSGNISTGTFKLYGMVN